MILRGIRILKWPEIWIGDSQGLGTEERDRDARGRMQQQLRGAQPVIREAGVLCLRRKDLRVLVHHGLLDDVIPFDRSMQQNPSPASAPYWLFPHHPGRFCFSGSQAHADLLYARIDTNEQGRGRR